MAVEDQVRNAFQNVKAILERAGGSPDNIGKVTVHLRDRQHRSAVNPQWISMFPNEDDRPVRHIITGDLSPGRYIQLEFIAVI